MIADFSRAGPYKGKRWLELEEKLKKNPRKFTKFKASSKDSGWTEVKKGYLYHDSRPVYKGIHSHDFEFDDYTFAMTQTYFNAIRKRLKPFKIRKFKKKKYKNR